MSHSDSDEQQQQSHDADFGRALAEARKAKNYSIAQISENLKIPEHLITAIEDSNLDALPAAIYTQGYIRTYARFLELSEDDAVAAYNRAMPHDAVSELKPRSSLPGEHSSQSPLVKSLTLFLLAVGLFAVIYGVFQYYQDKASDMEMSQLAEVQVDEQEMPAVPEEDLQTGMAEEFTRGLPPEDDSDVLPDENTADEIVIEEDTAEAETDEEPAVTPDTLEISAEKGAWLEVYDDTNARLFYNMVKSGQTKVISGQMPFRIKVGNADVTRVLLNGIEVDLSGHTRRNNTAVFTVSERDGNIVYH